MHLGLQLCLRASKYSMLKLKEPPEKTENHYQKQNKLALFGSFKT